MTIVVSGGFDPIHSGHVEMILEAAMMAPAIVVLNSDAWLIRKKGYAFQTWQDRAAILGAIRGVIGVHAVDDSDGTVCEALRRIRPTYFANGGDRTNANTPELAVCAELGITAIFGVGGGKIASSSEIVARAVELQGGAR
ncbi:adenylyltransferase/cytidyltransferase family protein [Sinorhizobium fredii]|uniref:adenylyltransferase/cytidyltransferase family protein n=1 Tax=Rhizobium fredii TaxID=380 RepID=UPI0004B478B0|nr:adenylyltransferase/cytidyltransferase family protein [Sinorhizobium fredii]ASY68893.1 hypothetical protein SF83666_c14720 [Sinorhizobium fredii CCBAU 83666]